MPIGKTAPAYVTLTFQETTASPIQANVIAYVKEDAMVQWPLIVWNVLSLKIQNMHVIVCLMDVLWR